MMKKLAPVAASSVSVTTSHASAATGAPKRHKLATLDEGTAGPKKAIRKPRTPSSNFPRTVAKQAAGAVAVSAGLRSDAAAYLTKIGEDVATTLYILAKNSATADKRHRPTVLDVKVACMQLGIRYNPSTLAKIEDE